MTRTKAAHRAEHTSLSDILERFAVETPDAVFLLTPQRDWTYRQVAEAAERVAAGLQELGVSAGDRVAIAAPNSAEWFVTLMATSRIGAALVALNVLYRQHEFDVMLNGSGAVVLICVDRHRDFDFVSFFDGLRDHLKTVREYVFLGGPGFAGSRRWDDLARTPLPQRRTEAPASAETEETPAVILYTSGTTGDPKGAMLTHRGILASASAEAAHLNLHADDVLIGHMPINHVGGLTCSITAAMVVGAGVLLLPAYHPQDALDGITQRGITVYIGVPTMYTKMMELPGFAIADLSGVRTCVIGGSNVEPALARRIGSSFPRARLANIYGLSETSGGCIMSAAEDDIETLAETLGVPIGDFEVRVVDDERKPLPAGLAGELQIRGAGVAAGYWQLPEATAASFGSDGWFSSGDMAELRTDGRVRLRGRKKEMYVRGGYNVYPAEIENMLAKHPDVAMSAVIGVPDATYGEVGIAFVVPRAGHTIDVADLKQLCHTNLARYKMPEEIRVVDDLPTTPTGKIHKRELQKRVG